MINRFTGRYRFLSNFYPAAVTLDGVTYSSVEHAYQAAKTLDAHIRLIFISHYLCLRCNKRQAYESYGCKHCGHRGVVFRPVTAGDAKRPGNTLTIRHDWFAIRVRVMEDLVRKKFTTHTELGNRLLLTGDEELIEGNTWGDRFWGVCRGEGENQLGKILMKVRTELRQVQQQ